MAFPRGKGECRIHAHQTPPYLGMFQGGLVKERSGTAPFTARKALLSGHMRGGGLFLSGGGMGVCGVCSFQQRER